MLRQRTLYQSVDIIFRITYRTESVGNSSFLHQRDESISKYFTMIYGEISTTGKFRFISAGHQPPAVFSREFGRFMTICEDRMVSVPPVGLLPTSDDLDDLRHPSLHGYKKRYEVNEINLLSSGDILVLFTDGLSEHGDGEFFPGEVESLLAAHKDETSEQICGHLRDRLLDFAPQEDDISVVVIKYTPKPAEDD